MTKPPSKQPRIRKRVRGGTSNLTQFVHESEALAPVNDFLRGAAFNEHPIREELPKIQERVHIPRPPVEQHDRTLIDEQQVVRVEQLMLRGFTDTGQLCSLLGVVDRRQMERYIRRVYARWEMNGSRTNFAVARGKALMRNREMQQQFWVIIQNMPDDDHRAKLVALNSLIACQQHEEKLMGLTDKVITDLNNRSSDNPAMMRMRQQDKLAEMAKRMGQLLEERRKLAAMDGEIMDPDEPDPSDYEDED